MIIEEQMVINTFLKTDCNCSGCLVNDSLIQSQSKICDDDDEENSSRILAMDVGKIDNHLDIHNVEGENCNSKPVTDVHTPVDNVEVVEEVADTGLRERLLQVEKVVEEQVVNADGSGRVLMKGGLQLVLRSPQNIYDNATNSICSSSGNELSIVGNE